VIGGERIAVFGDYDVDGATSSALLLRFFRGIGGNIGVYIPDRRKEGYGPNTAALLKLKAEGAAVVVTVDCGVTAFEPLADAKRAGLDTDDVHDSALAVGRIQQPGQHGILDRGRQLQDRHLGGAGLALHGQQLGDKKRIAGGHGMQSS
jgi:hypothetical protein